jgi:hypothetical protein
MDNGINNFEQLLYSRVANIQTTTTSVELHQIRPLVPPNLTPMDFLSENIADYRNSKKFDGMKVYRYACVQRARVLGLNLPFYKISSISSNLWSGESNSIKQAYINIAEQAAHIFNSHNGQFPEQVRVYVIIYLNIFYIKTN